MPVTVIHRVPRDTSRRFVISVSERNHAALRRLATRTGRGMGELANLAVSALVESARIKPPRKGTAEVA